MDPARLILPGVVVLLALNQVGMRMSAVMSRPAVFWSIQAVNAAAAVGVVALGLPGMDHMPVLSWFLGVFFAFRVVVNLNDRERWRRREARRRRPEEGPGQGGS